MDELPSQYRKECINVSCCLPLYSPIMVPAGMLPMTIPIKICLMLEKNP